MCCIYENPLYICNTRKQRSNLKKTETMKNYKEMTITELAKAICIYNGQRGTEKQIAQCKANFMYEIQLMHNFAFNRFK